MSLEPVGATSDLDRRAPSLAIGLWRAVFEVLGAIVFPKELLTVENIHTSKRPGKGRQADDEYGDDLLLS